MSTMVLKLSKQDVESRLKEINHDIHGTIRALEDSRKQRIEYIKRNDYEGAEKLFEKEKTLMDYIAKANYEKVKLTYPGADAIYEDKLIELCKEGGVTGMKKANLIECCANINGRKLYAL